MLSNIKETAAFIKAAIGSFQPEICIVLGSGLSGLADHINIKKTLAYKEIPNFPVSTVEGHKGNLVFGEFGGKNIVAMQGRFHYYEGYEMPEITFPIRVMKFLGVSNLFVSNAAGGLNPGYRVGDLMFITDHINMFPANPLRGQNFDELGPRFPDMSKTYNRELVEKAMEIAKKLNIPYQTGVYVGSSGPTLETPAEYKHFRLIGGDTTGMSTVPEVIVAHHMGMRCFGVSVITNGSAPADPNGITTHDEVQTVGGAVEPRLTELFRALIAQL